MEYVKEFRLKIYYGGRDGVHGQETRALGRVSNDRAHELAREMLAHHAVRVEIEWRQVEGEWTQHNALGADDVEPR